MTVRYDWRLDQPANPVAIAYADVDVAGLSRSELPEVRELVAAGWEVLVGCSPLDFFPAIWPLNLRTWVPDREVRYEKHSKRDLKNNGPWQIEWVLQTQESRDEIEDETDDLLAMAGIFGRPRGRIWLLKPPPGFESVEEVIVEAGRRAEASNVQFQSSVAYVQIVAELVQPGRRDETAARQ